VSRLEAGHAPTAEGAADVSSSLMRGGIALVLNSGFTSILGVVYWIAATHLYSPALVGKGSALVSALLTVSGFAQLNFARSLSGLLPRAGRKASPLLGRVYVNTTALSVLLGLGFAIIGPLVSNDLENGSTAWVFIPAFTLSTIAWTIFTLEDTALASVRAAVMVPIENGVFGVAKIVLLYAFQAMGLGVMGIFASWVLPLIVIIPAVNWYLFRYALPRNVPIDRSTDDAVDAGPQRWVRYDFGGYLLWTLGTMPLPFIIELILGPVAAAIFYVPYKIILSLDVLSLNVGNAFTAELQRDGGRLRRHHAVFMARLWALILVGSVLLAVAAPQVLQLFGSHYRTHDGIAVYLLLVAAVIPRSVMFLAIAAARAHRRGPAILVVQALAALGTIGLGVVLGKQIGVVGLGWAWFLSSLAAGVYAGLDLYRHRDDEETPIEPDVPPLLPEVADGFLTG
jgi:hypothetical protein